MVADITQSADAFLQTLTEAQMGKAKMEFGSKERTNWAYVPKDRLGLPMKELDESQRKQVHAILEAALSDRGHRKVKRIISLESVLFALEGAAHRDPDLYFLSVFGQPGSKEPWGWRFEGHHLSLNFTIVDGELIAAAPMFWGANPAEVRSGSDTLLGLRTLKFEEEYARELMESLTPEQRAKAIIASDAYRDVLTKNKPEVKRLEDTGILMSELNPQQRNLARRLIKLYLDNMETELAKARLAEIVKDGESETRFAWAGGVERGEGHYYRIQGASFLIEYDNVQGGANQVHAVWRDFDGDFGRDLLKEHYESSHSR